MREGRFYHHLSAANSAYDITSQPITGGLSPLAREMIFVGAKYEQKLQMLSLQAYLITEAALIGIVRSMTIWRFTIIPACILISSQGQFRHEARRHESHNDDRS